MLKSQFWRKNILHCRNTYKTIFITINLIWKQNTKSQQAFNFAGSPFWEHTPLPPSPPPHPPYCQVEHHHHHHHNPHHHHHICRRRCHHHHHHIRHHHHYHHHYYYSEQIMIMIIMITSDNDEWMFRLLAGSPTPSLHWRLPGGRTKEVILILTQIVWKKSQSWAQYQNWVSKLIMMMMIINWRLPGGRTKEVKNKNKIKE